MRTHVLSVTIWIIKDNLVFVVRFYGYKGIKGGRNIKSFTNYSDHFYGNKMWPIGFDSGAGTVGMLVRLSFADLWRALADKWLICTNRWWQLLLWAHKAETRLGPPSNLGCRCGIISVCCLRLESLTFEWAMKRSQDLQGKTFATRSPRSLARNGQARFIEELHLVILFMRHPNKVGRDRFLREQWTAINCYFAEHFLCRLIL